MQAGSLASLKTSGSLGEAVSLKVRARPRPGGPLGIMEQQCQQRGRATAAACVPAAATQPPPAAPARAPLTRLPACCCPSAPRLPARPQVSGDLQRLDNGKIKCQLTDGKENISSVFTSQVAKAFGAQLQSNALVSIQEANVTAVGDSHVLIVAKAELLDGGSDSAGAQAAAAEEGAAGEAPASAAASVKAEGEGEAPEPMQVEAAARAAAPASARCSPSA